jgi:aspartate aminotransferase-like enzyme
VEAALGRGDFDTLAVVHNETSTGVENPVREIAARARSLRPDLVIMVDAVSSGGGVPIATDDWGIDLLITSSQKCFALPPGLAFAATSDRALERAATLKHRGWYFDLLLLEKYHQRDTTPATPALSLLYALDFQLDRMLAEGMPARAARHRQMAGQVQAWASEHFELFAHPEYLSATVTSIRNTRPIEVAALNRHLAQFEMSIANGYGPLKDKTFRIGHMGEIQPADVSELLAHIDEFLRALP